MKIVDPESWNRHTSYNTFIGYSNPTFSITVRLDVTKLFNRCKTTGTSFFTDFLYVVMRSVNDIDEFRTRLVDEQVVMFDSVDPGFVVIKDDESITNGRVKMTDDYPEFYNNVRDVIEYVRTHDSNERMNIDDTCDTIYISCLPWLDFTSINHPYDYPNKESCSIPRITWGKVVENDEVKSLAFDVSAHHALIDGYQVYKLIRNIQNTLDDLCLFD